MTNKEIMKKLFHDRLNQEKNRQRILARITSEPQKQVVYGKWLRTATACMLVLAAVYVFTIKEIRQLPRIKKSYCISMRFQSRSTLKMMQRIVKRPRVR